jgi:hypothetical protein
MIPHNSAFYFSLEQFWVTAQALRGKSDKIVKWCIDGGKKKIKKEKKRRPP